MKPNEENERGSAVLESRLKLWNMHYCSTLAINLIINMAGVILMNLLPLFTIAIGGNNFWAGMLTTIMTVAAVLFRPVFGKMIDEQSRRKVLLIGVTLFAVATIMLIFVKSILVLFLLRFIQGIGLSAYSTALGTILSDVMPSDRIAEGVGYFGISGTIAMAAGPILGLKLNEVFGFKIVFVAAFGFALTSAVMASFLNYERNPHFMKRRARLQEKASVPGQKKKSFIEPTVLRPCIVMLLIVFAISSVFSFMPLFSVERSIENIGLFFTFYAIALILVRLFTGKLADRYGFAMVFRPAIAIVFLLFLVLVFAYNLPMVILAAVLFGIGYGTVQPLMNTLIIKFSPPERLGSANATYYATMDIGFGLGSLAWGLISQVSSFAVVFTGCGICIVAAVVLYYVFLHGHLKEIGY